MADFLLYIYQSSGDQGMKSQAEDITQFKAFLKGKHYSAALVEFLIEKIDSRKITTFQEINDIIQKDTNQLITHFIDNIEDSHLIQKKNPLCIEATRDYLYRLFRGVYKKCGQDINLFIQGLKASFRNHLTVINNSTNKVVDVGFNLMVEHRYTKILVYNYSKSISRMLRKLKKHLGNNLEVYTCQSSFIGQGEQMFNQLSFQGINCTFIADAEITYYINEVDCVLTGAEVVLDDGSILNRTGTYMLGLCAYDARKPMICFAESYKFIKKVFLTQKDIPNHMQVDPKRKEPIIITDLTYSKYIKLFVTDLGCLAPDSVSFRLANMFE